MQSSEEIERKRAVNCLSNLLDTYYSELEKNPFEVSPSHYLHDYTELLHITTCSYVRIHTLALCAITLV